MTQTATIHASAVLIGPKAVLIRGPAGAGKSQLAFQLLQSALAWTRLVADDRCLVEVHHGRLLVRPADELAGLIEIRGLGIRRLPYERIAAVGLVVDLDSADAARLPARDAGQTSLEGVILPRLAVGKGMAAMPLVTAFLRQLPAAD
ncbi:MAG TPA: serine kinase [Pseudolabrys sp.]|nr:serine kinase [Pseudolabrys sp.]